MSGEVPIETLRIIRDRANICRAKSLLKPCWLFFSFIIIFLRVRLPFWGPSHTPKFKNFFVHIRTAEKFMKFPHFTFKNAHQHHLQVIHDTTHPQTPNYFKFCTYVRPSVLYMPLGLLMSNTFQHTPPTAYIRFPPIFIASINSPTCLIPIKRLGKYCSPLKLLANHYKRGGALEIKPGTYPKIFNLINHSWALQQIRHFVPFWPFLEIFALLSSMYFKELLIHR